MLEIITPPLNWSKIDFYLRPKIHVASSYTTNPSHRPGQLLPFDFAQDKLLKFYQSVSRRLFNLPIKITKSDASVIRYAYNQNGQRIMKKTAIDSTYYVRDFSGETVSEFKNSYSTANLQYINYFGGDGDVIGQRLNDGGTWKDFYWIKDYQNNVRAVIENFGGTPNVANAVDYYAYGRELQSSPASNIDEDGKKFKFQGKELDKEISYYHYDWREYDPDVIRFNRVDRFRDDNLQLTPYHYGMNNPTNFIDMMGDSACAITNQWDDANIEAYRQFAVQQAEEYYANGGEMTCEDLALMLLIGFASENGLPLSLTDGDGNTFDVASDDFTSVGEFSETVTSEMGAKDLMLNSVSSQEIIPGNFMLMNNGKNDISHTQVITGTVQDNTFNIIQEIHIVETSSKEDLVVILIALFMWVH